MATEFTPKKQERFLKALGEIPNVKRACALARISRTAAYDRRKTDDDFAARWDAALDEGIESGEAEAWRRAVEGTDKPVTYQGEITATFKEYSDTLLIFLLKAHKPELYRDRQEIGGLGGGPVNITWQKVDYRTGLPESDDDGE